jgi:hypothetical protein
MQDLLDGPTEQTLTRYGQPRTYSAIELRKVELCADVWGETDLRFRHGKDGTFVGDTERGRVGESSAAAHCERRRKDRKQALDQLGLCFPL